MSDAILASTIETPEARQQRLRKRLAELKQMLLIDQVKDQLIREELTEDERQHIRSKNGTASFPTLVAEVRGTTLEVSIVDLALAADLITVGERQRLHRQLLELDTRHSHRREVPEWNSITHELVYRGIVIRQIRGGPVAKNIVAILDQFQAEGWRNNHITVHEKGPISDDAKLRDAIRSLNRGLRKKTLRFNSDGTGKGVLVRFLDNQTANDKQTTTRKPNKPR